MSWLVLLLVFQIAFNEGAQIAIHDRIYVAGFDVGSQVLNESVGMQHIRSDLTSEVDVESIFLHFGDFFTSLCLIEFVQSRAQDFHRNFTVLVLRALILALDYDAGGEMSYSDG